MWWTVDALLLWSHFYLVHPTLFLWVKFFVVKDPIKTYTQEQRTKNKNKRLRFCNKPLTIACFLELYAAVKSFSLRVPEAFTAFVILQQLNKSDMTKWATKFQPTSNLRSMQPLSHPAYIRLYNRGTLGNIVGFRTAKSSINFRLSCKREEISINGLLERKKYTVLKNC